VTFTLALDLPSMRKDINAALMQFIQNENKYLSKIGPELDPVANGIEKFLLDSGKRLRPLFAYVGFLATGSLSRVEIISYTQKIICKVHQLNLGLLLQF